MSRIALLTAAMLTAAASLGRAEDPWLFQGVVVPKTNLTLRIHSPQTVSEVVADVGDHVKKGDALIRFDDRQAKIDVQIAEIAVKKAEVELKRQSARMVAAKAMEQKGAGGDIAVVEAEVELARLEIEAAKAGLAAQQLKLDALTVRAPFEGMVVSRSVTAGDVVSRPDQQPLLEMIAGPYLVETTLPDQLLSTLKTGSTVYVDTDKEFGDKTYKGTISLVSPVFDPRTRSVKVRIALPPEATTALRVGLVVRVHNQAPKEPKEPKSPKD